ncbi:MAG: cobalt ECF transporter T component CbiQ, partial [Candidatus Jordarchaeaceae archaeon]
PLKLYVVRASFIPLFTVLIALPLPFIVPGNILTIIHVYGFNYLAVSFEGLLRAIVFVSRVCICVGAATLLVSTTRFSDLAMALRKMGMPELFTTLLLITYRYIFLFADEAFSMVQARNMRSFGREGFIKRIKVVGQMIGTLFLRAFERGEQVYYAMLSRGFVGKLESHSKLRIRVSDVSLLSITFAIVLTLIIMDLLAFGFASFNYSFFTYLVIDMVMKKIFLVTDFTRTFWRFLIV